MCEKIVKGIRVTCQYFYFFQGYYFIPQTREYAEEFWYVVNIVDFGLASIVRYVQTNMPGLVSVKNLECWIYVVITYASFSRL